MTRVLLVGGAGYVGSVISALLLKRGYYVRCFDNLIFGHGPAVLPFSHNSRYEFRYGDIRDSRVLQSAAGDVDVAVMLAGLVGDPVTKKYPLEAKAINQDGVRSSIESLRDAGIQKLIFISTCSNYGLLGDEVLATEQTPLHPVSEYAKAKVEIERFLLDRSSSSWGFAPVVLRFATAFGLSPRMRLDLSVNEFTSVLARGDELEVYDADTWRPYCHVEDFAEAVDFVIQAEESTVDGEVFNVGSAENMFTKRALVNLIAEKTGNHRFRIRQGSTDPRNYRVDFSKISSCGFTVGKSVEDGVDEVIWAVRNHVLPGGNAFWTQFGNFSLETL